MTTPRLTQQGWATHVLSPACYDCSAAVSFSLLKLQACRGSPAGSSADSISLAGVLPQKPALSLLLMCRLTRHLQEAAGTCRAAGERAARPRLLWGSGRR